MDLDLDRIVAIDVHTHAEVGRTGEDGLLPEWREAAQRYFGEGGTPTVEEVAAYYRERNMVAVVFTVDAETVTGRAAVRNEEILEVAAANPDVLIPFASVDPNRPNAVDEVRRLIRDTAVRGFKFHPNVQAFFPNDRAFYPIYEAIEEAGLPALFHTGHSGIGTGLPGGGGIRLKYSNPMHVDDVAVDFPDLTIVLAHPSFPWQDEAISVALHKQQVYIDLSGWSPKYFPPQLVRYANTQLRDRVLFGSDFPLITPGPLACRLRAGGLQGRGAAADPQGERRPPARPAVSRPGGAVGVDCPCKRRKELFGMSKPHGRLTQPLVRDGADLRPASWDEALDVVATGFAAGAGGGRHPLVRDVLVLEGDERDELPGAEARAPGHGLQQHRLV